MSVWPTRCVCRWLYIGITAGVAGLSWLVHLRHKRRVQQGTAARHGYTLPVTFALSTALLGGSQVARAARRARPAVHTHRDTRTVAHAHTRTSPR